MQSQPRIKRYTKQDNETIRRVFPGEGAAGVMAIINGRTAQSIQKQANRLGVRRDTEKHEGCWSSPRIPEPGEAAHPVWPAFTRGEPMARAW